jgi:hypothetical protein
MKLVINFCINCSDHLEQRRVEEALKEIQDSKKGCIVNDGDDDHLEYNETRDRL